MSETDFGVVSLTAIIILTIYVIAGSFFEAKHLHIIHETGLGILLGILAGLLFKVLLSTQFSALYEFNTSVFFYILLPVIIYSGGYNLNKRRFFQNFMYIVLFGVLGTIICFFLIMELTILINEYGVAIGFDQWIRVWGEDRAVKLSIAQIMTFSATICATDSVAALTMIKPEKYPKLFSVVFGEGMVNDAVSIIIYMSVGQLSSASGEDINFYWYTPFELLLQFVKEFALSLVIGISIGLLTTLIFKHLRFLTLNCVLETAIILYMGYISFTICELLELSGVISVLVTGITLAHYNFYNISQLGKLSSQLTMQTISLLCESAIYLYLGISVWTLKGDSTHPPVTLSWTFILLETLICFISRGISMAVLAAITILIQGRNKWRLTFWEMSIIWFAGLIRGSIAYALIQKLEYEKGNNTAREQVQIIQTSILIMVILSTIILGAIMPFYIVINLRQQEAKRALTAVRESSFRETTQLQTEGESEQSRKYRAKIQLRFKRIDERYIKPFFIFNFIHRKEEIEKTKRIVKQTNQEESRLTMFQPNARESGRQQSQFQNRPAQSMDMESEPRTKKSFQSGPKIRNTTAEQHLLQRSQPIMTKVTLRSSIASKFTGNQQFVFDLDVPYYPEEDYCDDNHDNDQDNDHYKERNDSDGKLSVQYNSQNNKKSFKAPIKEEGDDEDAKSQTEIGIDQIVKH